MLQLEAGPKICTVACTPDNPQTATNEDTCPDPAQQVCGQIPLSSGGTGQFCLRQCQPTLGSTSCDPDNPCSLNWIPWNGYLTIPTMALSGFLAVIVLLALLPSTRRDAAADEDPEHLSTV